MQATWLQSTTGLCDKLMSEQMNNPVNDCEKAKELFCHTGAESCFFNPVYVSDELKQFTWQGLYELIEGRKTDPKEGSYTTYLFDKGLEKILKKVGEESTEVIIAGAKRDKEETIYEISDLAYHVMVLMIELGISVEDITKELEKRHVIDHKVKQERMQ